MFLNVTRMRFVSPVIWSQSHRQGEPRQRTEPTRSDEDGSWQGQHDVRDQSPAPSVVSSLQSFSTFSCDNSGLSDGVGCFRPGSPSAKFHFRMVRFLFRITECTRGLKRVHMFSRRLGRSRQRLLE